MALGPLSIDRHNEWTTAQVTVTRQFVRPSRVIEAVRRPWTFMVYMAGDTGKTFDTKYGKLKLMEEMTSAGYRVLGEMGVIGTTANVAVVCLFNTQTESYLIEVRKGDGFADSMVRRIPKVNTGDPATLRTFVVQAIQAYPADHYALVLWGQGSGWAGGDAYAVTRSVEPSLQSHDARFQTTSTELRTGPEKTNSIIGFDDSSKDCLDTADLRQALGEAQALTGARLDLIGMDTGLMAMIEGARELAPYSDYFVASQEVELMAGWPYQPILAALDGQPGLAPAALAETIVTEFATSYGGHTREATVTQSAVVLARTETTEALCKTFVDAVLAKGTPTLRALLRKARSQTVTFQDRNYCDLGDFAARVFALLQMEDAGVAKTAAALRDHLAARGDDAPVLKVGFMPKYERATGLSVYLPPQNQPAAQRAAGLKGYKSLVFAQRAGWDRFIEWLYDEF